MTQRHHTTKPQTPPLKEEARNTGGCLPLHVFVAHSPILLQLRALYPVLLLVALVLTGCDDPSLSGRRGNAEFDLGRYVEAREGYREGLARTDSLPSRLRTALLNNTGLAYLAENNGLEALGALDAATLAAPTADLRAEVLYNSGLAAYTAEQRAAALAYFRRALLTRENLDDARYNWEVVKRQMEQEQNQQGGPPPPPPSDFAKELKARAEKLAAEGRYRDAHTLMQEGLQQDETVQAFGDFIQRLGTVADINDLTPTLAR